MKSNCWDIARCGRQPGGENVGQDGVCKVSTNEYYDGTNGGINAGRCCWRVSGTLFGGDGKCQMLNSISSCNECEVYAIVLHEEGMRLRL